MSASVTVNPGLLAQKLGQSGKNAGTEDDRPYTEAIVLCFDRSGSMGSDAFSEGGGGSKFFTSGIQE